MLLITVFGMFQFGSFFVVHQKALELFSTFAQFSFDSYVFIRQSNKEQPPLLAIARNIATFSA